MIVKQSAYPTECIVLAKLMLLRLEDGTCILRAVLTMRAPVQGCWLADAHMIPPILRKQRLDHFLVEHRAFVGGCRLIAAHWRRLNNRSDTTTLIDFVEFQIRHKLAFMQQSSRGPSPATNTTSSQSALLKTIHPFSKLVRDCQRRFQHEL
jgi:hypothetical protein